MLHSRHDAPLQVSPIGLFLLGSTRLQRSLYTTTFLHNFYNFFKRRSTSFLFPGVKDKRSSMSRPEILPLSKTCRRILRTRPLTRVVTKKVYYSLCNVWKMTMWNMCVGSGFKWGRRLVVGSCKNLQVVVLY